jgi:hypothetical protein
MASHIQGKNKEISTQTPGKIFSPVRNCGAACYHMEIFGTHLVAAPTILHYIRGEALIPHPVGQLLSFSHRATTILKKE